MLKKILSILFLSFYCLLFALYYTHAELTSTNYKMKMYVIEDMCGDCLSTGYKLDNGSGGEVFITTSTTISTNYRSDCGFWNTYQNTAPSTPTLVSPTDFSWTSSTPTLVWNAPGDIDGDNLHFKIELSTSSDFTTLAWVYISTVDTVGFSPVPPVSSGTLNCSYTVQYSSTLTCGTTYWWRVTAYDFTVYGSTSVAWRIRVDTTPPVAVTTVNDGTDTDIDFSSVTAILSSNWSTSTDPESGIKTYWYSVGTSSGLANIVSWTNVEVNLSTVTYGMNLVTGNTYYINIRAENNAGLLSEIKSSDGVLIDSTPPLAVLVVNDGTGADIDFSSITTRLSSNWSTTTDPESGIKTYWYSVGTSSGLVDILSWTDLGISLSTTTFGLSLVHNTTYYVNIRAENNAGVFSEITSSDGILIDTTPPVAVSVVNDGIGTDIDFSSVTTRLSSNWSASSDSESGISGYYIAIGSTPGGTNVLNWTNVGNVLSTTTYGLTLKHATTYYVSVKVENYAYLVSTVTVSDGVLIDTTPPTVPFEVRDGTSTDITLVKNEGKLSANWDESTDTESGIARYWYAISSVTPPSPTGPFFVDWTDNGLSTSVTRSALTLTNYVTYYFIIKAENKAGVCSSTNTSNGQQVEPSGAPTMPMITDEGIWTRITNQLWASWTSTTTAGSQIAGYEYAIGTGTTLGSITSVVNWTAITTGATYYSLTKTGLALEHGKTYYWGVKAKNTIDEWSDVGFSNGITVDLSTPTPNVPVDTGIYIPTTTITWCWTISTDSVSGVNKYFICISTTAGGNDLINDGEIIHPTSFYTFYNGITGRTYYAKLKVSDNAGNISGYSANSDGITVDTTPPVAVSLVNDGTTTDIQWSTSSSNLSANWAASSDSESGITKYWYAVSSTAAGGTDFISWTSTTATSVTLFGLSLVNGITYYFTVKPENGAGLINQTATNSNGQCVDITIPTAPQPTDEGDYISTTTVKWIWNSVSDYPSGVKYYYICVSTTSGGNDLVNDLALTTTYYCYYSGITGKTYYAKLKVEDNAGNISNYDGNSDGIMIDTTPPSGITFINDGLGSDADVSVSSYSLSANWAESVDNESGLLRYLYAVSSKTPGGTDFIDWTDNGLSTAVTRTDLSLQSDLTYYFTVKSQNRAGLYSSPINSDGILVDYLPPTQPGTPQDAGVYSSNTVLTWTWTASTDNGSGLKGYYFDLGSLEGGADIINSSFTTSTTFIYSNGITGKTYYARVRAQDNAGNYSSFSNNSDGITVDTTPPTAVGNVRDGFGADIYYSTYTNQLSANWDTATDSESGISKYWYAISSTTPGGPEFVNWTSVISTSVTKTGLALENGVTYYFVVKAENGAGIVGSTAVSNGQVVDTSIPVCSKPIDEGIYTATTTLRWNWTSSTDYPSGIKGYYIKITTGAGPIKEEYIGNVTYYIFYNGVNGKTHYAQIKAEDNAGNIGNWSGESDGILVDISPPGTPSLTSPADGFWTISTNPTLDWSDVVDNPTTNSGFKHYTLEVSSISNFSFVVYTSVTVNSICTLDQGLLPQKYYWRVKAEDNAGNYVYSSTRAFIVAGTKTYIEVTSSSSTLKADGKNSCTISAYIKDQNGYTYENATDQVTFTVNSLGTLSGTNPVNASYGIASITLISKTDVGIATVTATASGLISGEVGVYMTKVGVPVSITLTVEPQQIPADGLSVSTITAKIVDIEGNVVETATHTVRFEITLSTPDIHYSRTHSSVNYAYKKPVVASDQTAHEPATNVNDEHHATQWISTTKPAWIRIDLGYEKEISWVQYYNGYRQKYKIELLNDSESVIYTIDKSNTYQPGEITDFLFLPKKTRYVKLTVYEAENDPYAHCSELSVFYADIFPGGLSNDVTNYAIINASATASSQTAVEPASNINDGRDDTPWLSTVKPAWNKIDLKEPRHINKIRYVNSYKEKYKIELFDEFEKLLYLLDFSGNFQPEGVAEYVLPYSIPNVRYIKITMYDSETDPYVHCYELSAYGRYRTTYEINATSGVANINFIPSTNANTYTVIASAIGLTGDSIGIETTPNSAQKIVGYVKPKLIPSDGITVSTITAYICDLNNNIVRNANNPVTFSINGYGVLTNGATSYTTNAVNGIAIAKYTTTKNWNSKINLTSPELISSSVEIDVVGSRATYLGIEATPLVAVANNRDPITIRATIYDENWNKLPEAQDMVAFKIYSGDALIESINVQASSSVATLNYVSSIAGKLRVKAESGVMVSTETYITFLPDIYTNSIVYCGDDSGQTRIEIPARTFDQTVEIEITKIPDRESPNVRNITGRTRQIKVYKIVNGERTEEYTKPFKNNVKLIFYYTDTEYVDGITIFKWNEGQNNWEWQSNSKLVKQQKCVYLETNRFSIYTIGNLKPEQTKLYQNYPNPFLPDRDEETNIVYDVNSAQNVSIKIYNIAGELVKVLVDRYHEPARYHERWDGRNDENSRVASGIYLCQMVAGSYKEIIKIAVVK